MNVLFSPTILEEFFKSWFDDFDYTQLRNLAEKHKVPSLEENACVAVSNIVSIKKPKRSIEIGSGIGMSTLSILKGYDKTDITCIDGNLERHLIHSEYFKSYKNVSTLQMRGESFLAVDDKFYDFVFIDSVKREYRSLYHKIKRRLNANAVIIFDDILVYGYIACEESETPYKYRNNREEMLSFLNELKDDKDILSMQIIPVSGGLLVLSMS